MTNMRSFVRAIKPTVRAIFPESWRRRVRSHLSKRWDAKFERQPAEKVFRAVYKEGKWGTDPQGDFYSGSGSHDPKIVLPYIEAVGKFLESLPVPPSLVDLGCGDFNVGRQLRPYCGNYTACDVVSDLIARNQTKFCDLNIDFRRLDITQDNFPDADVAVLRQVLQHLSNTQILKVIPKLDRYKFLVLTEHLPADPDFRPNIEKPAGAMVRVSSGSGVVLTEPPFNLRVRSEQVICSSDRAIGRDAAVVKTTLYGL